MSLYFCLSAPPVGHTGSQCSPLVYSQLCVLYTDQLANSLKAVVEEHVGRRNTPTFNKYHNADLFKMVVKGMKEGGCVQMVKQFGH